MVSNGGDDEDDDDDGSQSKEYCGAKCFDFISALSYQIHGIDSTLHTHTVTQSYYPGNGGHEAMPCY